MRRDSKLRRYYYSTPPKAGVKVFGLNVAAQVKEPKKNQPLKSNLKAASKAIKTREVVSPTEQALGNFYPKNKQEQDLFHSVRKLMRKQDRKFDFRRELALNKVCAKLGVPYTQSPNAPTAGLGGKPLKYIARDVKDLKTRAKQTDNCYIPREEKEKFAQMLLRRMTTAEKIIRPELDALGLLPQKVVLGFIPDFWHPDKKVIVEIDGEYHFDPEQVIKDRERDEIFVKHGYKVLRFTNDQVSNDLKYVVEQIKKVVSV